MAGKKGKKPGTPSATIALNKKARFDYQLEEPLEAGIALEGWEVKALRAGHIQLKESYVLVKGGELWLFGAHISPLTSAATHITAEPRRTRKLLVHRRELDRLIGAVERKGYALVPLRMYWKRGKAKVEIALAKGKKKFDKRATEKRRDWDREKQRILRAR
jgi:SsrA-binding protein